MRILSINVGRPQLQIYRNKNVLTSGHKTPVPHARLGLTDFAGNEQADLAHHGGPDKAVCVYSFDHYPYWESWIGEKLAPGAFGENLTLGSLRETEVCIGDIFAIGEALAQISQPRVPCSKLADKLGRKDLPVTIHANGYSGFYFRVLREGLVKTEDPVTLVTRHPGEVTVSFAHQVYYKQRTDPTDLQRLLGVPELAAVWRETLSQRI